MNNLSNISNALKVLIREDNMTASAIFLICLIVLIPSVFLLIKQPKGTPYKVKTCSPCPQGSTGPTGCTGEYNISNASSRPEYDYPIISSLVTFEEDTNINYYSENPSNIQPYKPGDTVGLVQKSDGSYIRTCDNNKKYITLVVIGSVGIAISIFWVVYNIRSSSERTTILET